MVGAVQMLPAGAIDAVVEHDNRITAIYMMARDLRSSDFADLQPDRRLKALIRYLKPVEAA